MRYRIATTAGKNLFSEKDIIETIDEGINILQSLYEIDKAEGMNPEWTSRVAYKCTISLPNGLEVVTKTYLCRAGVKSTRKGWNF
jgi:hypothetical protein